MKRQRFKKQDPNYKKISYLKNKYVISVSSCDSFTTNRALFVKKVIKMSLALYLATTSSVINKKNLVIFLLT